MFYPPIRLRYTDKKISLKGPNLKWARWAEVNLDHTLVRIRIPRHKPDITEYDDSIHIKRPINLNQPGNFEPVEVLSDSPSGEVINKTLPWKTCYPLLRRWRFCGPWFTGVLGEVDFAIYLYKREVPDSASFFNPEAFEKGINDFLTDKFAHVKDHGASEWKIPLHWKVRTDLPVHAVRFDAHKVLGGGEADSYLMFPVSHDCLASLWFGTSRHTCGGDLEDLDAAINRDTMETFIDNILDTLEIELSPDAQSQYEQVKAQFPDAKLSKEREPLKWMTEEDEKEYEQYQADQKEFEDVLRTAGTLME